MKKGENNRTKNSKKMVEEFKKKSAERLEQKHFPAKSRSQGSALLLENIFGQIFCQFFDRKFFPSITFSDSSPQMFLHLSLQWMLHSIPLDLA